MLGTCSFCWWLCAVSICVGCVCLVECGGLANGGTLTHPANTLAIAAGDLDTSLVAEVSAQARGIAMVETLTALLQDVDNLPQTSLSAAQEAAMRPVRRIASRTDEAAHYGGSSADADMWWTLDRHHGLGNRATAGGSPSEGLPSVDSGDSHRRRRLLAVHAKEHL